MSEREKYPSEEADRFQVRMPPGLRESIKEAAEKTGRSMNAEIVARLQAFPKLQQTLFDTTRERAKLADDKERLEWELDRLERVRERFFNDDGSQKPVLTVPQALLDRIQIKAELNHRTLDSEALDALEKAFPPDSLDINILSAFLESLVSVGSTQGEKEYLDYINDALAQAKQPWTVRSDGDGVIRFYPYASPSEVNGSTEDDDK